MSNSNEERISALCENTVLLALVVSDNSEGH